MALYISSRLTPYNLSRLFKVLVAAFLLILLVHILCNQFWNKKNNDDNTKLHMGRQYDVKSSNFITLQFGNSANNTSNGDFLKLGIGDYHQTLNQKTKIFPFMNNSNIGIRMASRRERLQAQCMKQRSFGCHLKSTLKYRYYFFHDHNTSVCTIAKSASSTWRAHLRRVNKGPPNHIKIDVDARRDAFLNRPMDIVWKDISHSHNIITVRHPLIRLVSAFRNKYRDGKMMPPYRASFERRLHKRSAIGYWDQRFLQFWLPALMANDLVPPDTHTKAGIRDPIALNVTYSLKECEKLYYILRPRVNFVQFLNLVVKTYEDRRPDAHWNSYHTGCCVCEVDYDYITKVETLTEDLEYLFKELGIPSDPDISKNQQRKSVDDIYQDFRYYKNVPIHLKQKLYRYLKRDMDLFGYELPENFWKQVST